MTTEEMISLLLKARNLLHKQDEGKELSRLEITIAHDCLDMVIDELVHRQAQTLVMLQEMQEARDIDNYFKNQN